jgi:hypothetical protein
MPCFVLWMSFCEEEQLMMVLLEEKLVVVVEGHHPRGKVAVGSEE